MGKLSRETPPPREGEPMGARETDRRKPLSAFWPISEYLTTELWYNHQEYFYTQPLIGSLFVLCLHQTLLNRAFLLDDFRQLCQ